MWHVFVHSPPLKTKEQWCHRRCKWLYEIRLTKNMQHVIWSVGVDWPWVHMKHIQAERAIHQLCGRVARVCDPLRLDQIQWRDHWWSGKSTLSWTSASTYCS